MTEIDGLSEETRQAMLSIGSKNVEKILNKDTKEKEKEKEKEEGKESNTKVKNRKKTPIEIVEDKKVLLEVAELNDKLYELSQKKKEDDNILRLAKQVLEQQDMIIARAEREALAKIYEADDIISGKVNVANQAVMDAKTEVNNIIKNGSIDQDKRLLNKICDKIDYADEKAKTEAWFWVMIENLCIARLNALGDDRKFPRGKINMDYSLDAITNRDGKML
jgi:hypothetical protein